MNIGSILANLGAPDPLSGPRQQDTDDLRLRQAAQQLEGVFVEQLFKAMRETIPEGGAVQGGAGEEIFSALLDQHLAANVPAGWDRGLGAALYRQLRASLTPVPATADTLRETEP